MIHTNLGRAPLSDAAIAAMQEAARYSNLEFDLEAGARGSRAHHLDQPLRALTGAEARWSSTTTPPRSTSRWRRTRESAR